MITAMIAEAHTAIPAKDTNAVDAKMEVKLSLGFVKASLYLMIVWSFPLYRRNIRGL